MEQKESLENKKKLQDFVDQVSSTYGRFHELIGDENENLHKLIKEEIDNPNFNLLKSREISDIVQFFQARRFDEMDYTGIGMSLFLKYDKMWDLDDMKETEKRLSEIRSKGYFKDQKELNEFEKGMENLCIFRFVKDYQNVVAYGTEENDKKLKNPLYDIGIENIEFYIGNAIVDKNLQYDNQITCRMMEEFAKKDMQYRGDNLSPNYICLSRDNLGEGTLGISNYNNRIRFKYLEDNRLGSIETIFHENTHQVQNYYIYNNPSKADEYKYLVMNKERRVRSAVEDFYDINYWTQFVEIDARENATRRTANFLDTISKYGNKNKEEYVTNLYKGFFKDKLLQQKIDADRKLYQNGQVKKISKTSDWHKINYWMKYAIQRNPRLLQDPLVALEFEKNGDVKAPSECVIDLFNENTKIKDENGMITQKIRLGKKSPQKLKMVREMLYRNDSFKPENFENDLCTFNDIANNIIDKEKNDEYKKQFILLVAENFKKNSNKVKDMPNLIQLKGKISPLMVEALTLSVEIKKEGKSQAVFSDIMGKLPSEIQDEVLLKKSNLMKENKEQFKGEIVPQNELLEYGNMYDSYIDKQKYDNLSISTLKKIIKNPGLIGKKGKIAAAFEFIKNRRQVIEKVEKKEEVAIFDSGR